MAPPPKLTVQLSAVTPLFLGGAEPNEVAELRPPSFKGLLRYWYRALDGDYRKHEAEFFGSTDPEVGQSPCLLRVGEWQTATTRWDKDRYAQPVNRGGFQRGRENGINYLGYSLTLGENDRKAIPSGTRTFAVVVQPRPGHDATEVRRAWLAALWLLVHVGGVGSRARRGLGSLRIERWEGWEELTNLPLACQATTPAEWQSRMNQGVAMLHGWFPTRPAPDHTAFAAGAQMLLLPVGYASWEEALNEAGLRLQAFRRTTGAGRVGFGLPLRSPRVPAWANDSRMASPLFIRVLRLGQCYYPAFAALPAPPPEERKRVWPPGAQTVVAQFLKAQQNDGGLEVML